MERLEIIGNLTADPEMRTTQSGSTVCSFTVAVNQPPTKAQRESGQQPQAKFFRVSAWESLGDICQKYLAKGRKVFVAGTIRANAYMGSQDNKPHASLEMTAQNVEFLTPRGDQGDAPAAGTSAPAVQTGYVAPQAAAQTAPADPSSFTAVEPDDLPFD